MSSRVGALAFGAVVFCVCTPVSADPTYINVDGLPQLPSAPTVLVDINAKGDAVGTGYVNFVYKADGTIHLVKKHPIDADLTGINNQGQFTGSLSKGHTGQQSDGILGTSKGKIVTDFFVPDGKKTTEFTAGTGINDNGEVIGGYANADDNYVVHGFTRDSSGVITTFDAPGAGQDGDKGEGTEPLSINGSGFIAGYVRDSVPLTHCFIRDPSGAFTIVDANPGHGTSCYAINEAGAITGAFGDGTVTHGFVRSVDGKISSFDALANAQVTVSYDINGKGVTAGFVIDSAGVTHGFVRTAKGAVTVFDVPNLGNGAAKSTTARAINDKGEIVGSYIDASNISRGFIRLP